MNKYKICVLRLSIYYTNWIYFSRKCEKYLRSNVYLSICVWNKLNKTHVFLLQFECCGVEAVTDWQAADPNNFSRGVPPSCCKNYTGNQCAANRYDAFEKGCFSQLQMKVEKNAKILIGVGIGIAFVEVCNIKYETSLFTFFSFLNNRISILLLCVANYIYYSFFASI